MTYLKLFLTAFFWGGTFIAGRLIAGNVDPYSAAFLRFLTASVCLVFITIRIEGRLPGLPVSKITVVLLLGLTGIFSYNICFFSGLKYIQANQASLIIATNPVFITVFSVLIFRETLNAFKIAGLCLCVIGALTVISGGHLFNILSLRPGRGEVLIFGCVASWVVYSLLGKKAMNDLSPAASVCYSSIAGTFLLFFPAFSKGVFSNMTSYTLTEWSSLFYLGIFGTAMGFLWYYEGIKKIGPTKAGLFINFVPISAIVLSFFILKEKLTLSLAAGAALVITGVYLANRKPARGENQD